MTVQPIAVAVADRADDITHPIECGEHPSSLPMRRAKWSVEYDSIDVDGEPTGARLNPCDLCLGYAIRWAVEQNRGFTPPIVSALPKPAPKPPVPACKFCGAEFHACETTFRGLCVKALVAA